MVWRKYWGMLAAVAVTAGSLYGCAGSKDGGTPTETTAKETTVKESSEETAKESAEETAKESSEKSAEETAKESAEEAAEETAEETAKESSEETAADSDGGQDKRGSLTETELLSGTEAESSLQKKAVSQTEADAAEQTNAGTGEKEDSSSAPVSLTFWTYPVGGFEDEKQVQELADAFCLENPGVSVDIRVLDYSTGDAEIAKAIENGEMPDLVFEGPERLVANWADKGLMVPLDDMWSEEPAGSMFIKVSSACRNLTGTYYEYPLCMMVHTMALNRDVFEAADALQYLDEESGTWKSDDFEKAVIAVHEYLQKEGDKEGTAGTIYCKDQGGDQGTRALVTNLNSGLFTNYSHTEYTLNSEENIRSMEQIVSLADSGLVFDSNVDGREDIENFCSGEVPMTLCWNCSVEKAHPDVDFEILPMTFPSDDGIPELCGGIYGFGVFDNNDTAKIEAAKEFIRFYTSNPDEYKKAVRLASAFPVMDSLQGEDLSDLYEDDEVMDQYVRFMQYFGDYYQVVPGWPEARAAWWQMLQEIGAGADVKETIAAYDETVDAALEKAVEEERE